MMTQVKCYSSYTYAQEPRSFTWQGEEIRIKEIEKAWQEPGKRVFKVITEDGKSFELCYNEAIAQWSLRAEQSNPRKEKIDRRLLRRMRSSH